MAASAWFSRQVPLFDADLIRRYDRAGPRYTSYPTANEFSGEFGAERYQHMARASNAGVHPLSLYFHIPFCDTVCFYCACNKIITNNRRHADAYLERLCAEIALQGNLFDAGRVVDQLHWGGGTPTFLSLAQMRRLMQSTRKHFKLRDDDDGEYSIEIDPRRANAETMHFLRGLGFNRVSIGVQDFDPAVQRAVNRVQPESQVETVLQAARDEGFHSINFDLIYGLPRQDPESFRRTLERVVELDPDRLSIFNYAHLPQQFKVQRQIEASELPDAGKKLEILSATIEHLLDSGYVYIGMDHFSKPDDELAVAQRNGTLYRNFQGYSTHANCDLVAMGITGISAVGNSYAQNLRSPDEYYACIDQGRLAVFRGVELDADDLLRRDVISSLICNATLGVERIEREHGIRFSEYFSNELAALAPLERDGLIESSAECLDVTPAGRLLIRNICMTFDRRLAERGGTGHFSRAV